MANCTNCASVGQCIRMSGSVSLLALVMSTPLPSGVVFSVTLISGFCSLNLSITAWKVSAASLFWFTNSISTAPDEAPVSAASLLSAACAAGVSAAAPVLSVAACFPQPIIPAASMEIASNTETAFFFIPDFLLLLTDFFCRYIVTFYSMMPI